MNMNRKSDLIKSPSKYFSDPKEVILNNELNLKEKQTALYNWKDMLKQFEKGSNEGLANTTPHMDLERINSALDQIEKEENIT